MAGGSTVGDDAPPVRPPNTRGLAPGTEALVWSKNVDPAETISRAMIKVIMMTLVDVDLLLSPILNSNFFHLTRLHWETKNSWAFYARKSHFSR